MSIGAPVVIQMYCVQMAARLLCQRIPACGMEKHVIHPCCLLVAHLQLYMKGCAVNAINEKLAAAAGSSLQCVCVCHAKPSPNFADTWSYFGQFSIHAPLELSNHCRSFSSHQTVSCLLQLRKATVIGPKVYIFVLFHVNMSQRRSPVGWTMLSPVLGKCGSVTPSIFVCHIRKKNIMSNLN